MKKPLWESVLGWFLVGSVGVAVLGFVASIAADLVVDRSSPVLGFFLDVAIYAFVASFMALLAYVATGGLNKRG
jgi:predicted MFS family arabinose efflux permease